MLIFLNFLSCIFFSISQKNILDNLSAKNSEPIKTEQAKTFSTKTIDNKTFNEFSEEAYFSEYMKRLQVKIRKNWKPPNGKKSKTVIVLFKISKDGTLISPKIIQSSGIQALDDSAMEAVKKSAPFEPLPKEYKENDIDINFRFDYNVK